MAEPKEVEFVDDVPSWFMTFSDVITLLMTFFILLLTFSTTEPETFERMQVALFGGGRADGIAGPQHKPQEKDSLLIRERPKSGRITTRGSEIPPIMKDPSYESLAEGFKSLDESERRDLASQHSAIIPMLMMVSRDDKLTPIAEFHLKKLAKQIRGKPCDLKLHVNREKDLPKAFQLAWYLVENLSVPIAQIAVGHAEFEDDSQSMLEMAIFLPLKGVKHGT